jgi:hypothetical protein
MQKSEQLNELAKAMSAVQLELRPASKDANNPFFKSKYADLNSVWNACRDLLGKHGLAVIQGNSVGLDGTVIVETILTHSSGQWIQSELALPLAKTDPQGVGSAITYGRRYGLAAIIGIVADEDDDGNAASRNGQPKVEPKREQPNGTPLADKLRTRISEICSELNTAKDPIKWTVPALDSYSKEQFNAPFASLSNDQLTKLGQDLKERLTAQQENN